MRGAVLALIVLLLALRVGVAQDKPAAQPAGEKPAAPAALAPTPSKPDTPEQAADKAMAAAAARDDAMLKEIAAKDDPDPWLVADELCARGKHDEAEAFARAAPRADVEKLPDYVSARRGKSPETAARKALDEANAALAGSKPLDALAAIDAARPGDDPVVAIRLTRGRGDALRGANRLEECVKAFRAAADSARALGWLAASAHGFRQSGRTAYDLGDWHRAREAVTLRLAVEESRSNRLGVSASLSSLGVICWRLGELASARELHERSVKIAEELGDRSRLAGSLINLGVVCMDLGEPSRARDLFQRSLKIGEELGDRSRVSRAFTGLGNVCQHLGEYAKSKEYHERALAISEELGDRGGVSIGLQNLGSICEVLGDHAQAREYFERALKNREEVGDRAGMYRSFVALGNILHLSGDDAKAREYYELSLKSADELGTREGIIWSLWGLGVVSLSLDEPQDAVHTARRAVGLIDQYIGRLADEEGARARSRLDVIYEIGARAAARLDQPGVAAFFLESGRAGALLESLHARDALREALVPDELRAAEAVARVAETAAVAELRKSLDAGDLAAITARRRDLDAERERLSDAIARIQRGSKAAEVLYPVADSLDTIRGRLREGETLVLYGLTAPDALALVVTPKDARIVSLGATKDADAACAALSGDDSGVDREAAVDAMQKFVVDPLALDAKTRRVLISPDGALSYVSFAPLMPDKEVCYVPSGTTYGILRDDAAKRGDGVLALGDPDYDAKSDEHTTAVAMRGGGFELHRLPQTAVEAKSVGDVVLLGKDATESGLREALGKRPRWRAVHLACHGLVDPERPMFSSLALTPSADDDGFLTALDVFRMKVPADLVVLSACETGKGKVYKAEGIVGLTRAFMFAGAPRVLVSLWKVDDEATAALMKKFYELWNPKEGKPGLGAAAALRGAQEFVRSQENWKHPAFWAAWVLWGLPE